MGSFSKGFTLILILIMSLSSLIMVKHVFAQLTPTPSVPKFTLKLVGPVYLQNTTYSLDSNTGQIIAEIGYTNPYSALEIDVKNQPFDSSYGNFYYNVRVKDHNATANWVEAYNPNYFFPQQSNGSSYSDVGGSIEDYNFVGSLVGRQVDIQVEGMLGGIFRSSPAFASADEFRGATSGWSNAQTISVPANTPLSPTSLPSSPTSMPTVAPTSVNGAPASSILLLVIVVAVVVYCILVGCNYFFTTLHKKTMNRLISERLWR